LSIGQEPEDIETLDILWTPSPDDAHRSCGFHAGEIFEGTPFRWSQEIALLELNLPPGRHWLRLETLLTRLTTTAWIPTFYFNGKRIKDEKVFRDDGSFEFEIKRREGEAALLGWVSGLQPAPGDSRRLGLPVTKLSVVPAEEKSAKSRALNTAKI
jgi:hypothetical protein